VLDPFGGSGVTAVEALMNRRKAINIDLNPIAIF
jgi:DNA modification methylase